MFNKETQYLKFVEVPSDRKTTLCKVFNKSDELLGYIGFYPQWRKYVFYCPPGYQCETGTLNILFDSKCLQDIVDVLNELQQIWKDSLK